MKLLARACLSFALLLLVSATAAADVPADETSCDRTPRPGVAEVLFLDPKGRGHAMAYPIGHSVQQILAALRRLAPPQDAHPGRRNAFVLARQVSHEGSGAP
ncbi:hypothetical protein HF313_31040 [Massilia atriviolacea]|uniref:Uncharacterized protein n=1 Tax=Massilia atriviolacea TaxID=2495579 RepID=A0A430HPK7_9BURK|nr:hypothetical protein [Massilia atriviolacea]RSZ59451.1 hypothetical protein EJB06_09865 [Massilia atriviolacea]